MIRRILDFVFVLLFVWACMILGLWIIDSLVVPLELDGVTNGMLTGTLRVAVSALLVLLWLWIWREIVKKMFWRTVKNQQHFINKPRNNNSRMKR